MHYRGGDVVETERFVASLTVKMGMQVVDLAGATGAADCIFERACPVVNAVHKMVGQEKTLTGDDEDYDYNPLDMNFSR